MGKLWLGVKYLGITALGRWGHNSTAHAASICEGGCAACIYCAQSNATHIRFQNPPIIRGTLHGTPESRSQAYFVIFHRHSVFAGSF